MKIYVNKGRAEGVIDAPRSKSMAHRLLIAAALCRGESRIDGVSMCEDVKATIDCLQTLGVQISLEGDVAVVRGIDFSSAKPACALGCRESGSTLRFMIPLALLSGEKITLRGSEKLISRPQSEYERICEKEGFLFEKQSDSITVCGRLTSGDYSLRGDVSSQFITGLMFALSVLDGDSRIRITTKIESLSYIELTRAAMAEFGVQAIWEDGYTIYIKGGQKYRPRQVQVEGDYSGTAFIEAFNLIDGSVQIRGLNEDSFQGDRVYKEHFNTLDQGYATVDIEDCPDLAPILFTMAAIKHGGYFTGTRRLKIKESDRASAMKEELSKFGAELIIEENSVRVNAAQLHSPTSALCGHNDHRIVMSMAVICTLFGGEIIGCEAVSKSYPDFFKDIKKLGIEIYETD